MEEKFADLEHKLVFLHQQVAAGELYYDLGPRLLKLAEKTRGQKKAPFTEPPVSALFMVEVHLRLTGPKNGPQPPFDDEFLTSLLEASQSADPPIRNQVLNLVNWANDQQILTKEQLQWLVIHLSQPKYLYYHLGERRSAGLFARTNALTILRYALYASRRQAALVPTTTLQRLIPRLATILLAERDFRGFVEGNGWGQTMAILPGVINELCADERLTRGDKLFLMGCLLVAYRRVGAPLTMGEPDECAILLCQLVKRHPLYARYFIRELTNWRKELDQLNTSKTATWHRVFNYRHLMQAMLLDAGLPNTVASAIMDQDNYG